MSLKVVFTMAKFMANEFVILYLYYATLIAYGTFAALH
jgi:hypothetical protein